MQYYRYVQGAPAGYYERYTDCGCNGPRGMHPGGHSPSHMGSGGHPPHGGPGGPGGHGGGTGGHGSFPPPPGPGPFPPHPPDLDRSRHIHPDRDRSRHIHPDRTVPATSTRTWTVPTASTWTWTVPAVSWTWTFPGPGPFPFPVPVPIPVPGPGPFPTPVPIPGPGPFPPSQAPFVTVFINGGAAFPAITNSYAVAYFPGMSVAQALAATGVVRFDNNGFIIAVNGIPVTGNVNVIVRLNGSQIPQTLLTFPVQNNDTVGLDLVITGPRSRESETLQLLGQVENNYELLQRLEAEER